MDPLNKIESHDHSQATTTTDRFRALTVVLFVLHDSVRSYDQDVSNARRYLESWLDAEGPISATDAAILNHCFVLWQAEIVVFDALKF